jgi:hypothetical protein
MHSIWTKYYHVNTETYPICGLNYKIIGTIKLLSGPYALHAKYAENILHDISTAWIHAVEKSLFKR